MESKIEGRLDLKKIEEMIGGEISLLPGQKNNQPLIKFLAENRLTFALIGHLMGEKADRINGSILSESIDYKSEPELNSIFNQFNKFATGNRVKPGQQVCILDLEANEINGKNIWLSGFSSPKKITSIHDDVVIFQDGESFSRNTFKQIRRWNQVIMFTDVDSFNRCLGIMSLLAGQNGDWNFEIQIDGALKEADNPNYFGGSSLSAIPGTPPDLSDTRSPAQIKMDAMKARKKERDLRLWMGHKG